MPELERWVLHRLWELNDQLRGAVDSHDWAGVYPALHAFCSTDLSAFYFDIRKDALYCDRPDSIRRRAARIVAQGLKGEPMEGSGSGVDCQRTNHQLHRRDLKDHQQEKEAEQLGNKFGGQ